MNPQNTPPVETESDTNVPATPVAYVGNSNIVDRSGQADVYDTVPQQPTTPSFGRESSANDNYQQASSSLYQAIVLVCGAGSSAGWLLASYFSHNTWVAMIVAVLLAAVAIFFAVRDYSFTQRLSPLSIVGISGATLTLILVGDYWLLRLIIHSALSGLQY
jgi:hypothetical protein